jgi:hypothetical protein
MSDATPEVQPDSDDGDWYITQRDKVLCVKNRKTGAICGLVRLEPEPYEPPKPAPAPPVICGACSDKSAVPRALRQVAPGAFAGAEVDEETDCTLCGEKFTGGFAFVSPVTLATLRQHR